LTPFGAFVDLGGLEGLIHISEISRTQVKDPADVLSPDQEVTVQILNMEKDEKGTERISLSLKALEPDPWEMGFEFGEGDTVLGTVRNLTAYGAFVEIAPGVEGLVHISEISRKHVHHPKEKLALGQEVAVLVLEINKEQQRISLSIKDAPISLDSTGETVRQENVRIGNVIRRRTETVQAGLSTAQKDQPIHPESTLTSDASSPQSLPPLSPRPGSITKGIVRTVKPYGFFLDLPELGSHQSGLLHISQTTFSGPAQSKKGLKEGEEIEVEIIKIDDQGRISLSQKSILENQDRADFNAYQGQAKGPAKLGTMADLFQKKPRR
jgi:ribosomal protein S1